MIIRVLLLLTLLSSCSSNQLNRKTVNQSKFNYKLEDLTRIFDKAIKSNINENDINEYNKNMQRYLEKDYDGQKNHFKSKDGLLNVKFELKDSFKIVSKNMYCREYFQKIEYKTEIIKHSGVACRKSAYSWKNLILLTK